MKYSGETQVVKQGNSLFLRLDKTARDKLKLKAGDIVSMELENLSGERFKWEERPDILEIKEDEVPFIGVTGQGVTNTLFLLIEDLNRKGYDVYTDLPFINPNPSATGKTFTIRRWSDLFIDSQAIPSILRGTDKSRKQYLVSNQTIENRKAFSNVFDIYAFLGFARRHTDVGIITREKHLPPNSIINLSTLIEVYESAGKFTWHMINGVNGHQYVQDIPLSSNFRSDAYKTHLPYPMPYDINPEILYEILSEKMPLKEKIEKAKAYAIQVQAEVDR